MSTAGLSRSSEASSVPRGASPTTLTVSRKLATSSERSSGVSAPPRTTTPGTTRSSKPASVARTS